MSDQQQQTVTGPPLLGQEPNWIIFRKKERKWSRERMVLTWECSHAVSMWIVRSVCGDTLTTHTCDWLVSAQRSRHCGKPLVTMETVTSEPEDPRDSSNPQDCNTQLHYHRHYESRRQTHQQAWQPANALHRRSTGNYKLLMKQLPFKWGKSCSEKSPTPKLNAFTTLACKFSCHTVTLLLVLIKAILKWLSKARPSKLKTDGQRPTES